MKKMESLAELLREEEKCVREYNSLVSSYENIMDTTERRRHEYGEFEARYVEEQTEFANTYLDKIPDAEKAVFKAKQKIKAYFVSLA